MDAILRRIIKSEEQTQGLFVLYNERGIVFSCVTLELPWLDNARRISCIPPGKYIVVPRFSDKYGHHFHILDVPHRDYILSHWGNYHKDTLGCVLHGEEFIDINNDGKLDVTNSKATLTKMVSMAPVGYRLEII